MDKIAGYLEVGTNENGEVVVNLDKDYVGHIKFSPNQARSLATSLQQKATEAEGPNLQHQPTAVEMVSIAGLQNSLGETVKFLHDLKLTPEEEIAVSELSTHVSTFAMQLSEQVCRVYPEMDRVRIAASSVAMSLKVIQTCRENLKIEQVAPDRK